MKLIICVGVILKNVVNNKLLQSIITSEHEATFNYLNKMISNMEELFEKRFSCDDSREIDSYIYGALMNGGKRLRPILLCLSATFGNAEEKSLVKLMSTIELIHSASLVHDDIVDKSPMRRNQATINAQKGDAYATRCGFEMIASALEMTSDFDDDKILKIIADIPIDMCLGELRQLKIECDIDMQTEEDYFKRIEQKTSTLIKGSCVAGALASNACDDIVSALSEYGHSLGMLFQIRDDLLDFEILPTDGKPISQDIERGIYSLPIIYAVNKLSQQGNTDEHKKLIDILAKEIKTSDDIKYLIDTANSIGGIEYSKNVIKQEAEKAISSLERLPVNEYREVMASIVNVLAC